MKIGILTSVHPSMDTRIYFKQARSLADSGHDVYLVARSGGDIQGVHYVPVCTPRSRWARLRTCLEIVKRAIRLRCDAYHVHDPELLPFGVFVKLRTGARLTFDVHENVRSQIRNKYWIPKRIRPMVARIYSAIEALCLRWVDDLVLAEDSYARDYTHPRITVVRNYPIPPTEAFDERARNYSGQPKLAYCGVVAEIRGGLEIIQATEILRESFPEVELHVIGPFFPQNFKDNVKQRIARCGLQDRVHLYDRLPLDRALRVVAQCDIGLAVLHPDPNYVESLPTKMFEYMSLRMPVVVSNFPMWKEIVDQAGCGVAVDPLSPSAIAAAICEIHSPELLVRLGDAGHRAVMELYSWNVEKRRLLSVYGATLGHPGPRNRAASRVGETDLVAPGVPIGGELK